GVGRSGDAAVGIACSVVVFFFQSRRRHTRLVSDWSSDVCSSDLKPPTRGKPGEPFTAEVKEIREVVDPLDQTTDLLNVIHWVHRSEERRVGKEWRSRWSQDHYTKRRTEATSGKVGREAGCWIRTK